MGKYLGALISVVVIAGFVFGVAKYVGYASDNLPTMVANDTGAQGGVKHVSLTLQTFPENPYEDPTWMAVHMSNGQTDHGFPFPPPGDNQNWVTYWPTTNLQVPAHSLVTITIENYDGPTPLLNNYYMSVRGTEGNTAQVDGQDVTSVDPTNVSHTFTIHSVVGSNQPWLFVSVPITANNDDADAYGIPSAPVVTTFSFMTPDKPGNYIWQCFDPCGSGFNGFGGPMSTKGYMSGSISVVG